MTNQEYMKAAVDMANLSGGVIRERMAGGFRVGAKLGTQDFVTEVDVESERVLREEIALRFPDHKFCGEEEFGVDGRAAEQAVAAFGPDDYVWYVDPLDGTTNFVRHMPLFCVSIALAKGDDIVAAAVLDPVRSEMFSAARGGGAFLNGTPLRVSERAELADAIVSANLPLRTHPDHEEVFARLARLMPQTGGARVLSCAALCLAYVAAGRTDGHWEYNLKAWDMAAGALLVAEAGGAVTAADGSAFTPRAKNIIAANPQVHKALLVRLLPM